jgi:bifunctional non-homologous end joining protein LigD
VPVLAREPPSGPEWLHEVKFDGWRGQLHYASCAAQVFGRSGSDLTGPLRTVGAALLALPARSAIIDCELVACDAEGRPDFRAMMFEKRKDLCAWCFDLLLLNGLDLRGKPLDVRRGMLQTLLRKASLPSLRFSEEFPDPLKLLAASEQHWLEGVVSKRRDQPYRSGRNRGWVKVKTVVWRAANRERYLIFDR